MKGMGSFTLASLLALLCALVGAAEISEAAEKASFRLEWRLTGYHLPFFWAKEKGYYLQEGVDLEIKEGTGSSQAVNLVGGNQDTFGFADYTVMARAITQGMQVKGIYCVIQKNPWAIVSYQEKAIRKPQDLVGRSVAATAGQKPVLEHFLRVNNIPPDRVNVRVVTASARNTSFAQGLVDSFISIVIGSPLDFVVLARQGQGKSIHFLNFPDWGVDHLAFGIVASRNTIERKPDLIRRFLRATAKGWEETPRNIDAALQIALKHIPAAKGRADSIRLQFEESLVRLRTASTTGKPIGWMSETDWRNTQEMLLKTGWIPKPFPLDTYYTNDFVAK